MAARSSDTNLTLIHRYMLKWWRERLVACLTIGNDLWVGAFFGEPAKKMAARFLQLPSVGLGTGSVGAVDAAEILGLPVMPARTVPLALQPVAATVIVVIVIIDVEAMTIKVVTEVAVPAMMEFLELATGQLEVSGCSFDCTIAHRRLQYGSGRL